MGKYLETGLGVDERVKYKARMSWASIVPTAIISAVVVAIIGLTENSASSGMLVIVLMVCAVVAINAIVQICTTVLGFTNKKVLGKHGAISTKVMESPLNQINNVSVTSGLFGKLLGYGDVEFTSASGKYAFLRIAKPDDFRMALMEQIEGFNAENAQRQAQEIARHTAQAAQPTQTSNYDEIAKLKELLDQGAITQEDFDAKKKQLLGI